MPYLYRSRNRYLRRLNRRQNVGLPYRRVKNKREVVIDQEFASNTQVASTLYSRDISAVPLSSSNRNTREYFEIALQGVLIDVQLHNNDSAPHLVRMWVISHRGDDTLSSPLDQENSPVPTENFYKGQQGNRSVDYNGVSRGFTNHSTHTINTDVWNVLWSTKFMLSSNGDNVNGYGDNTFPNYKLVKKYIPIKRNLTYDNDSPVSVATAGRIFFVFDHVSMQKTASGTEGANMKFGFKAQMFFRDVM